METALIVSRMGIMQKITINNKENRIAIMEAILLKKQEDISKCNMQHRIKWAQSKFTKKNMKHKTTLVKMA